MDAHRNEDQQMNIPNQMPPYYAPQMPPYYAIPYRPPYIPKPSVREVGEKRDMVYALLLVIFSILAANFYLWGGSGIAASVISICLFLTGVIYILPYRKRCSAYSIVCIALYILCAASLTFSDDSFGRFFAIVAMIVLSALTLMELRQLRRWPSGTLRAVGDWCNTAFVYSFGSFATTFYALFHRKNEDGRTCKRRIGSVLLGIACAVPALLIIVPLLTDADAAFKNLLQILTFDSLGEILLSILLGFAIFLLLFGQSFTARYSIREAEEKPQTSKGIEPIILTAFGCVISLVYVLYLVSQLAYFFHAFSGLLPSDYTVAEYARRGFFEMATVCLINLGMVMAVLLMVRKKEGKEPLSARLFSLFLCVFSLLLIATAMSKMFLYIDSFGMTRLRILTSVFMVFLAVVFCAVGVRLFVRKLPYMKIALVAAVLLTAVMGFADLDRVVAKYNVEAYLSGTLDSIDMDALYMLHSDSIVPYVWRLTEDANEQVRDDAYEILYDRLWDHGLAEYDNTLRNVKLIDVAYDWRGYNIPEYEAFCLLKEHAQQIIDNR